jgi:hypothetical protein
MMLSLAPLIGLAYFVGVIVLGVYLVTLLRRHVLAQERIAGAVEQIARVSIQPASSPATSSDVGASA